MNKQVWIISDGRPGHYNQSRGIIKALRRLAAISETWLEARLRADCWRRPLRTWLRYSVRPLPDALLHLAYSFALPDQPPDLVVSAGGDTLPLNVCLARRFSAPNIFSGSLRGLPRRQFAAVLTMDRACVADNVIVLDTPATTVDAAEVRQAATEFRAAHGFGDERFWAMLIGGDCAGIGFRDQDWHQLVGQMRQISAARNVRWLLTTSRRTGRRAEDLLRRQLGDLPLAAAVWYGRDPVPVLTAYLGAAEVVCCTADSMTMVAEAVAAAVPLYTLQPRRHRPTASLQAAVDRLAGCGRLQRLNIEQLASVALAPSASWFRPLQESPASALADKLAAVLEPGLLGNCSDPPPASP